MEDVDAATPEAAALFFHKHYRPSNAVISLVGDIEPAQAFAKVEKYFGQIPGGVRAPRTRTAPLPPLSGIPTHELLANVPADSLQFVWRLPARDSKDFDAATLAIGILANGPTSRLDRKLVHEDASASGIAGGVIDLIAGTSIGLVSALALTGTSTQALEQEMITQIDRFVNDGPTAEEVKRAQTVYLVDWLSAASRFETRADDFSEYATLFGDASLANSRMDQIMSLSMSEVWDAARTYLQTGQRAVLHYIATSADGEDCAPEEFADA
jgi:predicted Zn-dependent peptidase